MPAARTLKKHSHSATPPSSNSGDDMDHHPKQKQKTDSKVDDKLKRKRQSQSCDACRARKVRCARPEPPDGQLLDEDSNSLVPMTTGPDGTRQVAQCKHCIALGIKCTYDYQPKKRGPPNLYVFPPTELLFLPSTPRTPPTWVVLSKYPSNSNPTYCDPVLHALPLSPCGHPGSPDSARLPPLYPVRNSAFALCLSCVHFAD
ncbi:hypothetical protein FRB99_008003 [Tulasnella sp. 403]|nr:hypothetical protein FRB99_008003 [Tulasnella sp. 403]